MCIHVDRITIKDDDATAKYEIFSSFFTTSGQVDVDVDTNALDDDEDQFFNMFSKQRRLR